MSGLLVKSVAVMKENLEEMNAQGVKIPVLLGGAALTRDYAEDDLAELYRGPLLYCKDAFEGLAAMDDIRGGQIEAAVAKQQRAGRAGASVCGPRVRGSSAILSAGNPPMCRGLPRDNPVPLPPFWGRRW